MQYWNDLTGPVRLRDCLNPDSDRNYNTLEDFIRNFHYLRVRDMLVDVPVKSDRGSYATYYINWFKRRYNLFDDCGLIIPLWKIAECSENLGRPGVRVLFYDREYPGFRRDPIPRTGNRMTNWFSTYYKTPSHLNEKKHTAGHNADDAVKYYNVKIRCKRNLRNLPNPWDDYPRSDIRDRKNWKSQRKTQWQPK